MNINVLLFIFLVLFKLVFDVPKIELEETKNAIKYEMENAFKLIVPLVVDLGVGTNWLEAH